MINRHLIALIAMALFVVGGGLVTVLTLSEPSLSNALAFLVGVGGTLLLCFLVPRIRRDFLDLEN